MNKVIQVLIVEDSEDDTLLLIRRLKKGGYDPKYIRVDSAAEMDKSLEKQVWDIIIADYSMPNFGAMDALALVKSKGLTFPFIIVSGAIGEEVAVEAMKLGAHDYFMKNNLKRLVPTIDRVLQEEAMRQNQKLESLGVVASGIAHDFNNLLQVILSQSSLALARLPLTDPSRKYIERVAQAGKNAAELTYQLLAYSGRGQFRISSINLNAFVEENYHLFYVAIAKNVEIVREFSDNPVLINADLSQIQQVLMNLIINAAESYNGRSGRIIIKTGTENVQSGNQYNLKMTGDSLAPGKYAKIEVVDFGSGMDEATLSRIFDPYFTTKFTGRGLGLAAVLGIVRGHKGGIQIFSEVNTGTTFKLLLPIAENLIEEKSNKESKEINCKTDRVVLVIDDDERIRESLDDMLEIMDVQVLKASNGTTGINIFREYLSEINLVLLDLSMPGLSGEETHQKLHEISSDIPILLMSGYSESEVSERFVDSKFEGFLQKPYTFDVLVEHVEKYIGATPSISKLRSAA
ncbi:MAG: response regulator [Chloroflexota bacterium]